MSRNLILNRIQCNECKEILISRCRWDFVACRCFTGVGERKGCAVDGGLEYLKRTGINYTEMSLFDDIDFLEIRRNLFRGNRGKDGKSRVKYIALEFMSCEWLQNCIEYNELHGLSDNYITEMYRKEQQYRKDNHISIGENS